MITLENTALHLTIRPDLGARIDRLQDRQTGKDWLWHPSDYDPTQTRSLPVGAAFDDHWTGGWDEIFPNDAAGEFQGYALVDHGELWSQAWEVGAVTPLSATLTYTCTTVPVHVTKTIQLNAAQPAATISYQFHNRSAQAIPFLFKQHAAIAIAAGDEILLPDCTIEPVDLGFSKIIGRSEKTRFPQAYDADGQPITVQHMPPSSSQLQEFYYCSELATGQCGIRHGRSTLRMSFDRADFPYVWMFQSYGGWRGHYVVVVEPCTTMPWDLAVAQRNGTLAQLQPHETQERRLTLQLEA